MAAYADNRFDIDDGSNHREEVPSYIVGGCEQSHCDLSRQPRFLFRAQRVLAQCQKPEMI